MKQSHKSHTQTEKKKEKEKKKSINRIKSEQVDKAASWEQPESGTVRPEEYETEKGTVRDEE